MTHHQLSPDANFRTSQLENNDGPGCNPTQNPTMGEIIAARFSRRGFLKGSLAVSAIAATVSPIALITADNARAAGGSAFVFDEVEAGIDEKHHVAQGYDADVLLRWATRCLPTRRNSTRSTRRPKRRRASSATTTTMSALSPSTARRSTGFWWSTTNTPTST